MVFSVPGGLATKNPPANAEDAGSIPVRSLSRKIPWRRKWQPTPVFLLGKCHEQRSLVGYSLWGCKKLDPIQQLNKITVQGGFNFSRFFFPHSLSSVENSWEPVSPLCQSFRSFYLPRFPHRNPTALHAFPLLELPATPMSQSDLSTCCWMCFMSSGALASGCPVPSTKHSPARPSTLLDTESSPLRSLKMYLVTGSHGLL